MENNAICSLVLRTFLMHTLIRTQMSSILNGYRNKDIDFGSTLKKNSC